MLEMMEADKKKFIPKTGYNVVGVDTFEDPGEQIYLIAHFSDKAKAVSKQKQFQKENPGIAVFIYDPKTR